MGTLFKPRCTSVFRYVPGNGEWEAASNFSTKGIGTGWFSSVLGGGYEYRPSNNDDALRSPVYLDNTALAKLRGDYAVPTLFNGNFDAIAAQLNQDIPGWSFHGGGNISTNDLIEWRDIRTQSPEFNNHLAKLGIDSNSPNNYALKLEADQAITHNRFVVPDWGVLRLDIHIPESSLNNGGRLKVYLEEVGSTDNRAIGEVSLEEAMSLADKSEDRLVPVENSDWRGTGAFNSGLFIKESTVEVPRNYEYEQYVIGYGASGFETFHFDVDPALRGKVVTLTLKLEGSNEPVYIDNVFFKSEVLKWGNPTEARSNSQFETNFLIEKPQYSLSYNKNKNTINWVAWKLDKTWLSDDITRAKSGVEGFAEDPDLNGTEWYQVKQNDYNPLFLQDRNGQIIENVARDELGDIVYKYKNGTFDLDKDGDFKVTRILSTDRGHMTPAGDRSRTLKDYYATFLTTNLLPQNSNNNQFAWKNLENDIRNVINNSQNSDSVETYMFAGGYGYTDSVMRPYTGISLDSNLEPLIQYPLGLWKVVLTGQRDAELPEWGHFGVYSGNDSRTRYQKTNIQEIEDLINSDPRNLSPEYNFLSNLPDSQDKQYIKNQVYERFSANLLADSSYNEEKKYTDNTSYSPQNNSIWQNNLIKSNVKSFSPLHFGTSQITTKEVRVAQSSVSEVDISHIAVNKIASQGISFAPVDFSEITSFPNSWSNPYPSQVSTTEIDLSQSRSIQTSIPEFGFSENSAHESGINQNRIFQNRITQVSAIESSRHQFSGSKISPTQISFVESNNAEPSYSQISFSQVSSHQISPFKISRFQVSPAQFDTNKVGSTDPSTFSNLVLLKQLPSITSGNINSTQINPTKISFPSSITLQQFLSSHNLPFGTQDIYKDNPLNLFDPTNPFNLTLEVTDLPNGQLAEAQVTHYTDQGIPNGGKILIDHNANDVGWFIDPTPFDHSEFTQTLADTALLATADSVAYGKYDLLTTILHEMGHLAGFISGYSEFDRHIQNNKTFIGDDFSATLTPDGSHLDPEAHPYDLMNNSLKPGIRKLPSLLDLQILNTVRTPDGEQSEWENILTAPLTSTPLFGINNGTFDTLDNWSTRGAANIIEGQAVLTEESRILSNFTQDFIIPDQAKYLQFTILDADLDNSNLAPGDAFEVALLNTNTKTPLAGITSEFSQTDALLNIQHDGDTYFSDKVKLSGAPTRGSSINLNSPRTVTIDIRDITPNTEATLYFDLLGFGTKESRVIIDNVRILTSDILIPIANNDKVSTNQGQPVIINVLDNDTDADGTINRSTIAISTAPTNGNITINDDNTITYTPNSNDSGADTFTYTVQDNEGNTSNTATVSITINNTAPSINQITVEPTINEGIAATFSANATDFEELSYTWDFGDNTEPATGASVTHTFADNGSYTATLTVTDSNGGITVETLTLTVNNIAPTVNAGDDLSTIENQAITFNGNYTDPGILDTHTISWDFGDGTVVEDILAPTHIYTTPGAYTATLTVTDKDGGTDSDTLQIQVNNAAPVITEINGDTNINEGAIAIFNVTAIGNELTYTWDFGDDSDTASGVTVNHQFADNGTYLVTLTVANGTGSTTSQTLTVNVDNVASVVNAGDNQITLEGTTVNFNGSFTDPGILDTHTIEWDFGDGSTVTDVLEPSHNYSQNGTYTVTLTITDSDGAATVDTLTVTVNNAAPIITEIISDTNINEGNIANFSATVTDPGNDILTYIWNFGDGTDPVVGNNVNHKYLDNGTYIATLTVTDSDGASTTQTRTVQVNNVAPIIGTITGNATVKKGETANFSVTATDPGNDTLTYTWNFGDGSQIQTGETVNHIFAQTGEFTVILTVTDSDGASTQQTLVVQAIPTAPKYAILSEKQVRINNGGDLDGNPLDLSDDALIYAALGFTINGNITLPVQRDVMVILYVIVLGS
ncbi:MAG: PKD domain-containing protein [Richelia sp. RM2_1_2]|nr:PKD domain-containing protein [Richelia sp. RM2_1_2]